MNPTRLEMSCSLLQTEHLDHCEDGKCPEIYHKNIKTSIKICPLLVKCNSAEGIFRYWQRDSQAPRFNKDIYWKLFLFYSQLSIKLAPSLHLPARNVRPKLLRHKAAQSQSQPHLPYSQQNRVSGNLGLIELS